MLTDELKRPAGRKVQVSLSRQCNLLQVRDFLFLPGPCCHTCEWIHAHNHLVSKTSDDAIRKLPWAELATDMTK